MKALAFLLPLVLAGCLEVSVKDETPDATQTACYSLEKGANMLENVLLNKCTGETWLAIRLVDDPDPKNPKQESYSYGWFPISRHMVENNLVRTKSVYEQ